MSDYSMWDLFRQEVAVQVNGLKQQLTVLQTQPQAADALESSTQAIHAIAGAARLVDLEAATELAQLMEAYLLAVPTQAVALGAEQIELLHHASDLLLGMTRSNDTDLPQWLADHTWDLATAQRSLAILIGLESAPHETAPISPMAASGELDRPAGVGPDLSDVPPEFADLPLSPDLETGLQAIAPPPASLSLSPLADSSMMELFRLEVEAQTVTLNQGLLALESQPQSTQELESLMRAAHSVKGAARIVGLDVAVNLAHVMEDCFVAAQHKTIALGADQVDVLLQGVDFLQHLSQVSDAELADWFAQNGAAIERTRMAIAAILNPELAGIVQVPRQPELPMPPEPITPEPAVPTQPEAAAVSPPVTVMSPVEVETVTSVRQRPAAVPVSPEATPTDPAAQDRVVRVSAENLNRIMGLAGESLIEANWLQPFADSLMLLKARQVELARILEKLQDTIANHATDEEGKATLELARHKEQECREILGERLTELELFARRTANLSDRLYREVITSHMRPFSDGVQGFPRMIRDLARQLNKQVRLEITGKSTPVDRDILKKLEAPLTHILRNAVDHGMETPEVRLAAGKSPEGTVRLEAFHRGGMLAITISDDGKGIDPEMLRQKVVKKGLTTPDMASKLTDTELLEFLFLPGFSTAQQVTEISGRGVGLDIAKSMAQDVGGTVRVMSQVGKGTSFHFQLPLTLSVVRTLLVEIAEESYAFPLARIEQIVMVPRSEISVVENRQYFTLDQKNIGLIAAHQVLELPATMPTAETLPVVIISDQSNCYGLVVDRFLGERDLVVRPLDPRLGRVQDISAAALMGDGSPILIVDVSDLVRSVDHLLNVGRLARVSVDQPHLVGQQRKRVLVVDDSITVREMERKLLQNRGYAVDVAVDGMEGWNAVRTNPYDLVISDIDMPRMNGIELIKQMKTHTRLNTIPVIVVSYRDREEDRIQGLEAGADYYLTKSSFHDESLIDAVIDLIGI